MKQIYRTLIMMTLAMVLSCQFANAQLKAVETRWGLKDSKGHLRTQHFIDAQQRKQGLEKRWNADGILMEQIAWKDDVMHGEHVIYYGPSGLGKIDSKLKYDMGIMVEEQRFGKPEKYSDNGPNVQMPYQMTIHRKWQIVNRETGERKLVLEKEWSPYYAKLVECLVTRPNGDIVYTNSITGEYGLQKSGETVMTLYKDNTMKQLIGKRGDNYELKYEYYDPNKDRDTKWNLPESFNVSGLPIKSITEVWTDDTERPIKEVKVYRTPARIARETAKIPYKNDSDFWCIQYDTIRGYDKHIKYVYDDGIVLTWSKQTDFKAFDKDGNSLQVYVKAKPTTVKVPLVSSKYNVKLITYNQAFVKDNFTFAIVDNKSNLEAAMPTIVKDIALKHPNVHEALANSVYDALKSLELRYQDLEMTMYKDESTYEVWCRKPYMLPDAVFDQLDSLCQIYADVKHLNEFQCPYQHLWLNDFKKAEPALINNVLERKSTIKDIISDQSMWFMYIDMNTMSGKITLDVNDKTYDIKFDKNGLSEAVRTFIRNYNNDYPMSDDERKAFLKDLKKRQRASAPRTNISVGLGGLLRHL